MITVKLAEFLIMIILCNGNKQPQSVSNRVAVVTTPTMEVNCSNIYSAGNSNDTAGDLDILDFRNCNFLHTHIICIACRAITLTKINMADNMLEEISDLDCHCQDIRDLDFSYNRISYLQPNSFAFAEFLRYLNLTRNDIHKIGDNAFVELQDLISLDISYNNLKELTRNSFNGLINLKELYLYGNLIRSLDVGSFASLQRLDIIDISYNQIYYLHKLAFTGLENLRILYLQRNRLSKPVFEFLSPFIKLSILDLSGNRFHTFSENACLGCRVRSLILRHSLHLKSIMSGAFSNCSDVRMLDLSDNPNLIFLDRNSISSTYLPYLEILNVSFTGLQFVPNLSENVKLIKQGTYLSSECYKFESDGNNSSTDLQTNPIVPGKTCQPFIVSSLNDTYSIYTGDTLHLSCFAFGIPWPNVTWQRLKNTANTNKTVTIGDGYRLDLKIVSLNVAGLYRCEAKSSIGRMTKDFSVKIQHIDVGLKVLASNARAIVVTWNQSYHVTNHIVLYRAYEKSSKYVRQHLNEYWKVFKINSLTPMTQYEVCIASYADIHDKTCVRAWTKRQADSPHGIQHNVLAIGALTIAAIVFVIFFTTTVYRCARKIRVISKQSVFVVGTESRECFDENTESTFHYENQFTDFLLENEEKTDV